MWPLGVYSRVSFFVMNHAAYMKRFLDFNTQVKDRCGRFVNFQFDHEEARYITFPNHVEERSAVLRSLISCRSPVIVDAFACVGGDSIALMGDFPDATLYAVQRVHTEVERQRFARLTSNVNNYNTVVNQTRTNVLAVDSDIEDFMSAVDRPIDLLYLDPPWEQAVHGPELGEADLVANMLELVALARGVRVVVLKIRNSVSRKSEDLFLTRGYRLQRSIAVRKAGRVKFYFHVFSK
jgi:hypothetical protein